MLFGVVLVASLFVVSFASAMLVGYLSNSVTATVTILPAEEPEVNVPETIDDCKDDGWMNHTRLDGTAFNNQGQCVSYVATNMCKDDGWKNLTKDDGSSFNNQGQCVAYFSGAPDQQGGEVNTMIVEEEIEVVNESVEEIKEDIVEEELKENISDEELDGEIKEDVVEEEAGEEFQDEENGVKAG